MPGPDPDSGSGANPGNASTSPASKQDRKWKAGLQAAGRALTSEGDKLMDRSSSETISPVQYKRGGKVRKTGIAKLHKNERVIPAGKVKRVEKMMRKKKMRMKARN